MTKTSRDRLPSFPALLTAILICALSALPIPAAADASAPAAAVAGADTLDLAAFRGKVVYLDFWASWCKPCRASFPWMNTLQETYGPKGLVVLAVNVDKKREAADKFLRETPATFRVLYDPQGKLAAKYQLKAMPSSFVYDREGKLRETHVGFHPEKSAEVEKSLQALLGEGSKSDTTN